MNVITPEYIRTKLRHGMPSVGTWLQIPSADVAEIMAHAGYDWLVIDMEHGSIDVGQLPHMLRAITCSSYICERSATTHSSDAVKIKQRPLPMVRVPKATTMYIRRALDAGARGLIFPMIQSRKQLDKAIEAATYPQSQRNQHIAGRRGVGYCRANGYGHYFSEYVQKLEKGQTLAPDILLVAQIEHKDALENLESLVGHPRLDALMVGPYDLSASLQVTGQCSHPDMQSALQYIEKICKKYQIPLGIHVVDPSPETVQEMVHKGYTFVAYGLDAVFLWKNAACPAL